MDGKSTEQTGSEGGTLLSVGHSNHSMDRFVELLRIHRVEVVVDVRSQPFSRFCPHFDRADLQKGLPAAGVRYLFLGKELGGRPEGPGYYDEEGHVLYDRLAASSLFLDGIARLEKGVRDYRIALLCSEENPVGCHRRLLVARVLATRNLRVDHIRGNGKIQTEEAVRHEELGKQVSMFAPQENSARWRSVLPIRKSPVDSPDGP